MKIARRAFAVAVFLMAVPMWTVAGPAHALDGPPIVQAVLFYSPTCPHCEVVLRDVLPPLYERYGSGLQVVGVNTLESEGWALYGAAVERYAIPEPRQGVPTLIVREVVLVGPQEIAQQFPDLIEAGLAAGGIPLPDIPGLLELLPPQTGSAPQVQPVTWRERFARDTAANSLAVVVLLGMVASLGYAAMVGGRALRAEPGSRPEGRGLSWPVPVLALAGLGVAGYLAFVETLEVAAVCGPVGDCNTVQQSEYARLFGVLPIGVLGAIGYLAVLAAWAWQHSGVAEQRRTTATLLLFGVALAGTLFSTYLTFLEPFVIGATCAWCLSSAVIITALMLVTARPGLRAAQALLRRTDRAS